MKRLLIVLLVFVCSCSFAQIRGGAQYDPAAARRDLSNASGVLNLTLSGKLDAGEAEFGTTGTIFNSAGALVMPNNTAIGMKQVGGDIKTFGYLDINDHMNFGQSGLPAYFPGSTYYGSGTWRLEAGTAAAPAYSFSSDPDTGIYSPGADTLGFCVNGAQVATISSTGLGLSTPLSLVNGGTGATTASAGLAALGGASLNGSSTVNFAAKNLTITGFSTLGDLGTGFKMKILATNTSSIEGGQIAIPHNLTSSKIIAVTAQVKYDTVNSNWVMSECQYSIELQFSLLVTASSVIIQNHATNSGSILSKPVVISIWYTE